MKARKLIITTATAAALAAPAAQTASATNRIHQSPATHTRIARAQHAAYVALANDGLYQVAIHTILAG
jgi:hypothetical protein